jgi:DNA-directed RNA polymerase specialized sigma subunit
VKFISYAVWWIRQTVLQALAEQTRSVRIPLNQNSNLARLARTDTALTQQLGRTPTDQEIAEEMVEPVETVRALRRVAASELSLDAPIDRGDRDSASFGERFAGLDSGDIEEERGGDRPGGTSSKPCSRTTSPSASARSSTSTTGSTTARSGPSRRSAPSWA